MPAYVKEIPKHSCQFDTCGRLAAVEAFNTYNALIGRYCRVHGNAVVKRLNNGEAKS